MIENYEIVYEVIGYPTSCPEETFSVGLYKTEERATQSAEDSYEEYDDCEFNVEIKQLYD